MTVGLRGHRRSRRPEARWSGWVAASGLLHALLLLGLASLMGSATRAPEVLHARLVVESRAAPVPQPERQPPPQSIARPAPPAAPRKVERPLTPSPPTVAAIPAESLPGTPLASSDPERGMSEPAAPPATPTHEPTDDGGGSRLSDPAGEGEARSPSPRSGASGARAEAASSPSGEGRASAPPQSEAAVRGMFLVPEASGSGTGRTGLGGAGQGSGTGGGGIEPGGQAESGGLGGGTGVSARWGTGGSGEGGSAADLVRSIRRRIEDSKIYPEAARRQGIQGTVDLRFRIAADGSVETLEILRSSGFPLLDEASRQTIRRAAPFPRVQGWVRLPLSYRLDQ